MQNGFSLVELAIVLVILGLLAGGIITGQSLIRAAELQSVVTEYQKLQTAVRTFQDKYFALPGDMTNATAFWGEAHPTPTTCGITASTSTETCNGNGDGNVFYDAAAPNEHFRFWQHLANAGLIEGSYTGVANADHAAEGATVGLNIPASKLSNAAFFVTHFPSISSHWHYFDGNYGNLFHYGNDTAVASTYSPALTPAEAWGIDKKVDDGKPAFGRLLSWKSTSSINPNCTTTVVSATSEYNLSNTATLCSLVFITGW